MLGRSQWQHTTTPTTIHCLQPPAQPLCPRRAPSHPYLFMLFQQLLQLLFLLLFPLAVVLGGSQLRGREVSAEPTLPPLILIG